MSAAASFTHYASSPRVLYRAILRELRKSAPPAVDPSSSSSLKAQASTASSSADLRTAAAAQLAGRASAAADAPSHHRRPLPPFLLSPALPFIRRTLETEAGTAQGQTRLRDLANIELFMRSKRVHGDLLTRYNPTYGMTEQERVRLTARRVGLDVPQEYDPDSADEANAMAAATLEGGEGPGQRKGYTGPLPPPRLDQD